MGSGRPARIRQHASVGLQRRRGHPFHVRPDSEEHPELDQGVVQARPRIQQDGHPLPCGHQVRPLCQFPTRGAGGDLQSGEALRESNEGQLDLQQHKSQHQCAKDLQDRLIKSLRPAVHNSRNRERRRATSSLPVRRLGVANYSRTILSTTPFPVVSPLRHHQFGHPSRISLIACSPVRLVSILVSFLVSWRQRRVYAVHPFPRSWSKTEEISGAGGCSLALAFFFVSSEQQAQQFDHKHLGIQSTSPQAPPSLVYFVLHIELVGRAGQGFHGVLSKRTRINIRTNPRITVECLLCTLYEGGM